MKLPPLSALNDFDWLLLALLFLSTALAFRRGIIRVLFSILGVFCGIVIAGWNYLAIARDLSRWIASFRLAEVVAFVVVLVVVVLLFGLAGGVIRKAVSAAGLGIADRLFGAAFGFLRGLLLGVAALMALAAFAPDSVSLRQSVLAPYFLGGVHAVSFGVPDSFQLQISEGITHLLPRNPGPFKAHTLKQRSE